MKYSNKFLSATSAVALGVGLLIGSTNAVFADNSKTTDSNTDAAKTDSNAKKGPAQTSTSYNLMVKVGSNKSYPVYKRLVMVSLVARLLMLETINMHIFNPIRELRHMMQLTGVFMSMDEK